MTEHVWVSCLRVVCLRSKGSPVLYCIIDCAYRCRVLMMLLLLRLRDRCAVFLRRRVQTTSTPPQATQRPSCRYATIDTCLSSMAFAGGVFVIVAVIYAAYSPHWVDVDVQTPGCREVRAPVTVEVASPHQRSDIGGSSDIRANGVVDFEKTSSNLSGAALKDRPSRCTTSHLYIGPWTICAIYDTNLDGCGKTVTFYLRNFFFLIHFVSSF